MSLAASFHEHRSHLRSVAFRMLGSLPEAEDALQDAWLRMSRADATEVRNLEGWMTTVVARVCLDLLRSRRARREQPLEAELPDTSRERPVDPEHVAMMADAVGLAMLVVLDTLTPAERVAFVLHEMFGMPFDEIAAIAGRSSQAARQLVSRARKRLHGAPRELDLARQRAAVEAYLAALRASDLPALLRVLDPQIVLRADRMLVPPHLPTEVQGRSACAKQALELARGARAARTALIDGRVGLIVAPHGKLLCVLVFGLSDDRIASIEVIGARDKLQRLQLALLADSDAGTKAEVTP